VKNEGKKGGMSLVGYNRSDTRPPGSRKYRILDVASIACSSRLEQEALHFLLGDRPVFDAVWYDHELPRPQHHGAVAHFDAQRPLDGEEELVFQVMAVPDKLTAELHKLHFLPVKLAHHLRAPILRDSLQFGSNIDFVHNAKVAIEHRRNNSPNILIFSDLFLIFVCTHHLSRRLS
jgi:hypothetical protein